MLMSVRLRRFVLAPLSPRTAVYGKSRCTVRYDLRGPNVGKGGPSSKPPLEGLGPHFFGTGTLAPVGPQQPANGYGLIRTVLANAANVLVLDRPIMCAVQELAWNLPGNVPVAGNV
jgi:hypothetical protein